MALASTPNIAAAAAAVLPEDVTYTVTIRQVGAKRPTGLAEGASSIGGWLTPQVLGSVNSVDDDMFMAGPGLGSLARPLFEDIELESLIGQGGFGRVYLGFYQGAPVAVKVLERVVPGTQTPPGMDRISRGFSQDGSFGLAAERHGSLDKTGSRLPSSLASGDLPSSEKKAEKRNQGGFQDPLLEVIRLALP